MPHVSFRVSEQEKNWMDSYARVQGVNLSDAIKEAFFEKLENEYDLKIIKEYEAENRNGTRQYFSIDAAKKELGLICMMQSNAVTGNAGWKCDRRAQ